MNVPLSDQILDNAPAVPSFGPPLPNPDGSRARKPSWIRAPLPAGAGYVRLRGIVDAHHLHTVCQSASCPNMGECWGRGWAAFMILGNICTRSCGFCHVATGRPLPPDPEEPAHIAEAVRLMGLRYAVLTCVDRDDLPDKGANHWAETIRHIRHASPETIIETLIPDYTGDLLKIVLNASPISNCQLSIAEHAETPKRRNAETQNIKSRIQNSPPSSPTPIPQPPSPASGPDILAHNLEVVPRISKIVRPQAKPERSLTTLREAKSAGFITKTSLMLGLGETVEEVQAAIREIVAAGVDILTLGQYLQPSHEHLRVERFVTPQEFQDLKTFALSAGIKACESGPLVRSSYYAEHTGQEVLHLLSRPIDKLPPSTSSQ